MMSALQAARSGTTSLANRAQPRGVMHAPPVAVRQQGALAANAGALGALQALSPQKKAMFQRYIAGRTAQPAAAAPAANGVAPTSLGGVQEAQLAQGEDQASEAYRQAIHNNEFQQGQLQQSYLPQFRDMQTQFGLQRNAEPEPYVQRGILGSGIDHQALQTLDINQGRQYTDLSRAEAGGLSALQNARNGIESSRAQALAGIHQQRLAALAKLAIGSIK